MKGGCWEPLTGLVKLQARDLRRLGLARWEDLATETRERLSSWSPAARKLWESDFLCHNEAMVRAWIWHYLDDNLFSFAGGTQEQSPIPLSSPVWENFRALRREFNALRHDPRGYDCTLYRIQFHTWNRIAEHFLRRGLGQKDSVNAADLVAHYKRHLRLIVEDGENKIPDHAHDGDFEYYGDLNDPPRGVPNYQIRDLLSHARKLQYYLHGLDPGSYTIRFTPIDSDKMYGFPFDKDWMELNSPVEIPCSPPNSEELSPVQLVSDPMLVISGLDGLGYERDFTHHTSMQVVVPWTFGGEEAAPFLYPGYEKGWEQTRAKWITDTNAKRLKAMLKGAAAEGAAGPMDDSGASQTTQDHATDEGKAGDQTDQSED
ncbi:hypothetical protein B0I37DRAFT_301827 [Chaetomium sp. MPI-CAGE-AT-0009]|nr:hypothetical protein B0I37DRAFT_301827 [Chaetomium sp. MPI-CAGE-AT-0009]